MSGNRSKVVKIDLTTQAVSEYPVDPAYYRDFIGGSALAARLFFDLAKPDVDPFSEDNPIILLTGPLVGTRFPGSSRFTVCAKSPQTGIWGESSSGGAFGVSLKKAGLDGLIITGIHENPCYIRIDDGAIEIHPAEDLWGLDTYETIDQLVELYSDLKKPRVLAIGPAGENLVRFASVCNDKGNHLGRIGMGAVMGSKKLKAIVVSGTSAVPIANEASYKQVRKDALEKARESIVTLSLNQAGTATAMEVGMLTGDVPIKNWSVGEMEELGDELGGNAIVENILVKRKACADCPIACKPEVRNQKKQFDIGTAPGPEYETLASFGSMTTSLDLQAISKANDLCNRLGMDTISCGATVAFIMEAFEKQYYTKEDLDGLGLSWGNMEATLELIQNMAFCKGFGKKAAEGSAGLAKTLPDSAQDFLVAIKGLELPMHDPRGFHGMGLAYMMSNRGACHLQHSCQSIEQCSVSWPEAGLEEEYQGNTSDGKAKMVYIAEGIGQMANIICICHFAQWAVGLQSTVDGLNAVTGSEFTLEDYINCGHRAWLIKRVLNNLMGVTQADDVLPARVLLSLEEGGTEGTVPDEELLKKEYYSIRGLDTNGVPTAKSLEEAGLDFLKKEIADLNR